MDWEKFIVPITLENSNEKRETGDRKFRTQELIYLDDKEAVVDIDSLDRVCYPTDYAVMNGVLMSSSNQGSEDRKSCWTWLRSVYSNDNVYEVSLDGDLFYDFVDRIDGSLRPALQLNLSSVISERSASRDIFKIADYKVKDKVKYHTIEFGEYPKTYVGDKLNEYLERAMSKGTLKPTGKKYIGHFDNDGNLTYNDEYMFEDQRYVRVISVRQDDDSEFLDGTKAPKSGTPLWARVEPITWIIRNWDEMPRSINPEGTGNAKVIDIQTDEAIISGIPFYPNGSDNNCSMWQNSTIRGYLNGYNVNNITMNGNKDFTAPNGGDFTKNNFLKEAFDMERILVADNANEELKEYMTKKKSRLATINPDTTPINQIVKMTDTEKIKSWIDNGESVLLRGPSGIGKTERIRREYGDRCIYLKLTNNMFPEKVVGSVNLQTGQEIPPNYAKEAILACATAEERKQVLDNIQNIYDIADAVYERSKESDEKIVILLDELLNVKPAVQSLVYTLVLNRFVENGKGLKLPKNVVVVATGNQKKYSSVAEDLAEPLEKRFAHIYDMTPKFDEWLLEYAIPNKLHPSIINYMIYDKFVGCLNGNIENLTLQEFLDAENGRDTVFYEEPDIGDDNLDKYGCRGKTNDPRSWVTISQMLYNFENDLTSGKFVGRDVEEYLRVALGTKLRENWAESFFDFYSTPTITTDDVLCNDIKFDENTEYFEIFATLANLLAADENEVGKVRKFIRENMGKLYIDTYDTMWCVGSSDRKKLLEDLDKTTENQNSIQDNVPVNDNKSIHIRDFFRAGAAENLKDYCICDSKWQAEIMCSVADKLDKTMLFGDKYTSVDLDEAWEVSLNLKSVYGEDSANVKNYENKGITIHNCGLVTPGRKTPYKIDEYKRYDFSEIDFSGVLTRAQIANIEERLNKKIAISEFLEGWDSQRIGIHCRERWQAEALCETLDKADKTWVGGESFADDNRWQICREKTVYISGGLYSSRDFLVDMQDGDIYEFEDVFFDNLSLIERNKLSEKSKNVLKVTLDEFLDTSQGLKVVKCENSFLAKRLCGMLHKKNLHWADGGSYRISRYDEYKENSAYGNDGQIYNIDKLRESGSEFVEYDFENIDLTNFLSLANFQSNDCSKLSM